MFILSTTYRQSHLTCRSNSPTPRSSCSARLSVFLSGPHRSLLDLIRFVVACSRFHSAMTLTLPILRAGLSDIGRSPPTDKLHPSTLVYRTLSLPAHNLTDITLLASYPHLTALDLSHNALAPATTAATLSRLPHLTTLTLNHCNLTSFTLSAPLSSLLTLSLAHNQLSELPSLALSPFVTWLDISYNAFPSIALSSLRYLQSLDASHNDILYLTTDSLPSLALSHVTLSHNRLFTLTHVAPLPSLLTLDLTHNFFQTTASLAAITATNSNTPPPLHTLLLTDNYIQTLSALSSLPSLPHLRGLSLDGNSVAKAAQYRADVLYLLPRLRVLDGAGVDVQAVTASEEAAGDDDERRAAVWHDRLPSGHSTRKWQVDDEEKSMLAANQGRQAALYTLRQPRSEAEEEKDEQKQDADTANYPPGDHQSHERHIHAYLPEQRYWQVMSERGLVHPWTTLHHRLTAAVASGQKELLDVSHTALGECGVRALAHWLTVGDGPTGVRVLDLTAALDARRVSSRLSNEYGFGYLLDALPSTAIHSLSLSRCQLTDRQCQLLSAHLASPSCQLQHLDLSHNALGSHLRRDDIIIEQCPSLAGLLSAVAVSASSSPLLSLNLAHNSIDRLGCTTLARFLSSVACHLTLLSLDANPLTPDGLSLLSHSLHANTSLVHLSLRHLPSATLTATHSLPRLTAALARFNRHIRVVDLTGSEVHEVQTGGVAAGEAVAEVVEGRGRSVEEGVQEVRMKGVRVTGDGMAVVGRALKENKSVRVLELGANPIEPLSAASLVSLCEGVASSVLEELDLAAYSADINSNSAAAALSELLSYPTLRHMSLPQLSYSADLSSEAQQQLVTAWQEGTTHWQRLNVQGSGQPMNNVDEAMLLALLSTSSSLATLHLTGFSLSDSFVSPLAAGLTFPTRLVSLSLLSCQLSSAALSSLLAALPVGLREFDLSGTVIGQFGFVLPRQLQLASLTLSKCGITSISSAALSSLVALPTLTSLRLSHNPLSAASFTSLASIVFKQPSSCPLRVLDVSGCALSDGESSLQSLCALVRAAGRSLHELHLPAVEWLDGQQADGDSSVVLTRLLHALTSATAGVKSGGGVGRLRRLMLPPSLPLLSCHHRQLLTLAQQGSQPALEWVGVEPVVEGEEPVGVVADAGGSTVEDDAVLNSIAASFACAKCVTRSQ